MSEVISFRLNKNNLREAKALFIIQERRAKGYNLRQIITDALLMLDENNPEPSGTQLSEFQNTLIQVNQLLSRIDRTGPDQAFLTDVPPDTPTLSDHFISAVKKNVKMGMKLNN
jgi:hypothetical protein